MAVDTAVEAARAAAGPLAGRVAIVTGAASPGGIGRAIAEELHAAGARVVLADLVAPTWASPEDYVAIETDVTDAASVHDLVERTLASHGRLDILVNNAGITADRTLLKMSEQEWDRVIAVDLKSVFLCSQAAARVMKEQGYGRIVSISSIVAETGAVGQCNYAAAKSGILGFTRSAALELARYGITVNAVCPGYTDTQMTAAMPAEVRERIVGQIPLGRMARPEEIARAVRFLCENPYITGQELGVNGGLRV